MNHLESKHLNPYQAFIHKIRISFISSAAILSLIHTLLSVYLVEVTNIPWSFTVYVYFSFLFSFPSCLFNPVGTCPPPWIAEVSIPIIQQSGEKHVCSLDNL